MNIDPHNPNIQGTQKSGVRSSSSRVANPQGQPLPPPTNSSADNVSLSSKALALGELERAVKDSPDVDIDNVARVKSAIADKSYNVDVEQLAHNMLDHDDFFGPP